VVAADQSHVFERLGERHNGHIRRCPVDLQAMMEAAAGSDAIMATDGGGNFIFPALHPVVDGLMAIGKLLELLASQRVRLSEVVAELPISHVATREVAAAWEAKGRVMRCLVQQFGKYRHERLDGIKVYLADNAWVLIRPDADAALFHVVAEAATLAAAQEIAADYGGLVENLAQMSCGE
jgi:phosphomannomutase